MFSRGGCPDGEVGVNSHSYQEIVKHVFITKTPEFTCILETLKHSASFLVGKLRCSIMSWKILLSWNII